MVKRIAVTVVVMALAAAIGVWAIHTAKVAQNGSQAQQSLFKAPSQSAKDDQAFYKTRNDHGSAMIPGGVYNQATLIEHAKLYPMCDLSNAYFARLPAPMVSHVSYMHDGQMYWTKRLRVLPAGEFVIYAGPCLILQRCGNLLDLQSLKPQPTMEIEPFDVYPPELVPMPAPIDPIVPPRAAARPEEHTSNTTPSSVMPPSEYVGQPAALFVPGPGVPVPVVDTPEPGTVLMLFLGVLVLAPMVLRKWEK